MKKAFFVFMFVVFVAPAWGQERIRVGFIDIQRAIGDSQAGKKARERFQAQVKKVEVELLKEKGEVEKLKVEVDKKGPLLKEDDRKKLESELQRRVVGYQRNMRDSQEELRQKEGEMTADILKELETIVTEVGKNDKFTLILERSQVLYSDQAMDITGKVIDLYNNRASAKAVKGK